MIFQNQGEKYRAKQYVKVWPTSSLALESYWTQGKENFFFGKSLPNMYVIVYIDNIHFAWNIFNFWDF